MELGAWIESTLSDMEATHQRWLRYQDLYTAQRAALERGWLTEAILPPSKLQLILDHGHEVGLHAPSIEWFYEHVRILPMQEDAQRLVFSTELPPH